MRRLIQLSFVAVIAALLFPTSVLAFEVDVSLRGSPNSMLRQNQIARDLGYEFVEKPAEVQSLVYEGVLVSLNGNRYYEVKNGVSYPYARPEVRLFIERLAEQYFKGTGERLVVTSLVRPASQQPRNSHKLSVHPTGIAIDLRISSNARARAWLESVLLKLERRGVLDVTRESYPPHYHVALFTGAYRSYLVGQVGEDAVADALLFEEKEPVSVAEVIEESAVAPASEPAPSQRMAASAMVDREDGRWVLVLAAAPLLLLLLSMFSFWERVRGNQ